MSKRISSCVHRSEMSLAWRLTQEKLEAELAKKDACAVRRKAVSLCFCVF